MKLAFHCPACQAPVRLGVTAETDRMHCATCGWTRPALGDDLNDGQPRRCLVCGTQDLWKQKDFPQRLGLLLVGTGAVLSSIAWANYWIVTAFGVLMLFAFADLLLFLFMGDVLVCYRCRAKHYPETIDADHPHFDLEVAERYRQEAKRVDDAQVSGNR